ncbi:MAG TPA: hypothetical protein VH307_17975 [Streptosporangiaceae bacterium]|nr:hypothetical protein [Streptosporangiaceae bacterium]
MIVILAIGVPIGAWGVTRLRPPPAVTPLGTGYDPIDKWLLTQHSLPPLERERVRAAVLEGRRVRDPLLTAAARDLAAKVVSGEFKALRVTPVLRWIYLASAAVFAAMGIGLLVTSKHAGMRALGALGLVNSALFTVAGVLHAQSLNRIHRHALTALELNQDQLSVPTAVQPWTDHDHDTVRAAHKARRLPPPEPCALVPEMDRGHGRGCYQGARGSPGQSSHERRRGLGP